MDLSAFRAEKVKKAKTKTTIVIVALVFALSAVGFFYVTKNFFQLKEIKVVGSSRYIGNDIAEMLDLDESTNLFYMNADKTGGEIYGLFPYVESVTVEKQLPNTLVVYVKEAQDTFFYDREGRYYILSAELKVLDMVYAKPKDLVQLIYPAESVPEICKEFVFNKKLDRTIFAEILSALRQADLLNSLSMIDYTDKFNLAAEYDGRITIWFESYEGLERKARRAYAAIHDLEKERGETVKGNLFITENSETFDPIY